MISCKDDFITKFVAKGYSYEQALVAWSQIDKSTIDGLIREGYCTMDPVTPTGPSLTEAQRLTAKLNAGQCFTDAEIAWARVNEPTLYNWIWGKSCQPVTPPTPTPTPLPPGQCPVGYRKMTDSTKRFMTFDCPSAVAASILAQVAENEARCIVKYSISFPGGYYLVENGIQYGAGGNCAEVLIVPTPIPSPTPTPPVYPPTPTPPVYIPPTPTPPVYIPPTPTPPVYPPTPTPPVYIPPYAPPTEPPTEPPGVLGLNQTQILMLAGGVLVILVIGFLVMQRR